MPRGILKYYNDNHNCMDRLYVMQKTCLRYIESREKWMDSCIPRYRGGWRSLRVFHNPAKTQRNINAMEKVNELLAVYLKNENEGKRNNSFPQLINQINGYVNSFSEGGHGRQLLQQFIREARKDYSSYEGSIKAPEDIYSFRRYIGGPRINSYNRLEVIFAGKHSHVIRMSRQRRGSIILKQVYRIPDDSRGGDLVGSVKNEAGCFADFYKLQFRNNIFYEDNSTGHLDNLTHNYKDIGWHQKKVAASFVMPDINGTEFLKFFNVRYHKSEKRLALDNIFRALSDIHHKQEIVHGNIKLDNILITPESNAFFTGFRGGECNEKNITEDLFNLMCCIVYRKAVLARRQYDDFRIGYHLRLAAEKVFKYSVEHQHFKDWSFLGSNCSDIFTGLGRLRKNVEDKLLNTFGGD
ncbi:MAG: hypothetical protein GY750_13460 [Lentisphaerae bacterium]|nr:hypothetical protein [Lentisphaerota bacterium]MCP4102411.1 hypothetical protein [Lentisphaerota bacterium]